MIILSGWISTKMQWKLRYDSKDSERGPQPTWTAWPADKDVEESGAPVFTANDIEGVIEKIKIFEQGTLYESDIDK